MIDRQALLTDLQRLLRSLEDDLLARSRTDSEVPEVAQALRDEYDRAKKADRTALNFEDWRSGAITQNAAAWVLSCVFVRFLEDNELISPPKISGAGDRLKRARDEHELYFRQHPTETDREYLLSVFDDLAKLPGTQDVFGKHNPLNQHRNWLSGDAAGEMLQFFQRIDANSGELVHDFTDPDWDTRFLGDLYQDLSEAARKKFALLQTPEFVEEFILDRTLEPALDEFGLQPAGSELFKMIDPACGSGHFLLGSFRRILDRWQRAEPGTSVRDLVQNTLDSIHGVDINPFAIAIARFRLLLAALRACDVTRLADAPAFHMNLACGDSLYHGRQRQMTLGDDWTDESHYFHTEDAASLRRILKEGTFHCVVANPPYITPKDRAANQVYRKLYPKTCHMKYSLAVPFMERIFRLAVQSHEPRPSGSGSEGDASGTPLPDGRGSTAGFTGQITANSFMKREFGKKLIESFFPTVDLTHVIDTSGAYIPGHGTPTVILLGRHRKPVSDTIRTVMGIRGEPSTPDDPSQGRVWSAIVEQIEQLGSESEFVSVGDSSRDLFHKHPWSIGGGGASELKEQLEASGETRLAKHVDCIGFGAILGEDEAFGDPPESPRMRELPTAIRRPVVEGDRVRDWSLSWGTEVLFPYDSQIALIDESAIRTWFWPLRTVLLERNDFSKQTYRQVGRPYWEYHQIPVERNRTPLSIVFAFVATHNHFVLDRGGKVFNRSAPVIKLPPMIEEPRPSGSGAGATHENGTPLPDGRGSTETHSRPVTEDDHLALLGLLNSSTACFWMKQVFHDKGSTVDGRGARQTTVAFENFREFTGTGLQQFPLPADRPLELARRLDALAAELQQTSPAEILTHRREGAVEPRPSGSGHGHPLPDGRGSLRETLSAARVTHAETLGRMIRLQEDLDWQCYRLYGLIDEDLIAPQSKPASSRARQEADSPDDNDDRFLTGAAPEGAVVFNEDWNQASNEVSSAETEPQVYFCTFTCYGTWLHGDARGSVDRNHNQWLAPQLEPDEERERQEFERLKHDPVKLGPSQRSFAHAAIEEVCEHRGWRLHALNVRTNHVHVVVTANRKGKRVLNDFKSYATRKMKEYDSLPDACVAALEDWSRARQEADGQSEPEIRVWTRGGSARPIDTENSFRRAIEYTRDEQGPDITPMPDPARSRDRKGVEGESDSGDRFLTGAAPESPHPISLGERAFEIVLARKMERGEVQTTWFERHGSTPITELPDHWPDGYKRLVERRIEVIATNPQIALIEQPEYKRRWNTEPWESQAQRALKAWLLDRLEGYFDFDGRMRDVDSPRSHGEHGEEEKAISVDSVTPWSTPPLADIQLVSVARLADVAAQDDQFLEVASVYKDQPAPEILPLVKELVTGESVPLLPVLRYKPAGLRKRAEWEQTWHLQRLEDRLRAGEDVALAEFDLTEQQREAVAAWLNDTPPEQRADSRELDAALSIPVPPKYKSSDFISTGGARYWALRGKLDVPKERWISFPHCEGEDGTLMICWAGYDHLQQARAISAFYVEVQEHLGGRDDPRLIPLLACLIELLPWLKQWHNDIDPEFDMAMGDYFEGFIEEEARGMGRTIDEIKAWEPPKKTRKKASRKKKAVPKEAAE